MIDTSIEPILGNQVYAPKKVGDWTSAIVESVLKLLQAANKPFKYVVTCIIMQKNGAGLHTASTCFWDTKSDGEAPACADHLKSSDLRYLLTALDTGLALPTCGTHQMFFLCCFGPVCCLHVCRVVQCALG